MSSLPQRLSVGPPAGGVAPPFDRSPPAGGGSGAGGGERGGPPAGRDPASAGAPPAALGGPARRLRDLPGFGPLIGTYAINDIGDLLAMVALAVVVYDGTNSVWGLAGIFLASKLVPSLVAPWLVARLAHMPVGRSLPPLYLIEAALFTVLVLAVMAGAPLGVLVALACADGLVALAGRGLTRGVMATLFESGGLLRDGNGFVSQLNGWLLVGATFGAFLVIEQSSPVAVLWVDVASFLIAAVILLRHGRRLPAAEVHAGAATGGASLRDGLRHIWRRTTARRLVVGETLVMGFSALVIPVEVVYARDSLGAGSAAYGLLLAAWGLGAIGGATLFRRNAGRNIGTIVWLSTLTVGAGYGGLAAAPALWVALVASVIGGAGNGAQWVAVMTALQEAVGREFYARASAVLESIVTSAPAVAYVAGAVVTAAAGPRTAYAIGAAVALLMGVNWALRPVVGGGGVAALGRRRSRRRRTASGDGVPKPDGAPAFSFFEDEEEAEPQAAWQPVVGTRVWVLAAAAALALVVYVGLGEQWRPDLLAALALLAVVVAPLAVERPEGSISGVLLVVVLAAMTLGPAQAAIVGIVGTVADMAAFMRREGRVISPRGLLSNPFAYMLYALLAGLLAEDLASHGDSFPSVTGSVVAVYGAAFITNAVLVSAYVWSEHGVSPDRFLRGLVSPTVVADLVAVTLTVAGVYGVWHFGLLGVVLIAGAVVVFLLFARRFLESVDNAVRAENARVVAEEQHLIAEQHRELTAYSQRMIIVKIMRSLAAKDPSTARHSAAVAGYMEAFARHCGFDPEDVLFCALTGLLHDVGKMYVPETILNKPGRLDATEFEIVKRHAADGADFVRDLDGYGDLSAVILAHHERWGGGGYPHGLIGNEIPEFAAMISVCDVYDVLTSRAIYRAPIAHEDALAILVRDKGSYFKPDLVDAFIDTLTANSDLRRAASDEHGDERFETALQTFLGKRPDFT